LSPRENDVHGELPAKLGQDRNRMCTTLWDIQTYPPDFPRCEHLLHPVKLSRHCQELASGKVVNAIVARSFLFEDREEVSHSNIFRCASIISRDVFSKTSGKHDSRELASNCHEIAKKIAKWQLAKWFSRDPHEFPELQLSFSIFRLTMEEGLPV
jgi:hypothetical protein